MRRVIALGPPGSGTSTLARRLGKNLGLPVCHPDQAFHLPGRNPVPPEIFRAEVERLAALPARVIDGNDTDTIAPRYDRADTIIHLDLPSRFALLRVIRRMIANHGRVRPEGPAFCPERCNLEVRRYVWTWNRIRRARTLPLIDGFVGEKIILRGRRAQMIFGQQFPDPPA